MTKIIMKGHFKMDGYTIETNIERAEIPRRYLGLHPTDFDIKHEGQRIALKAAMDFTRGSYNTGLIMCGKNGTGKSMLSSIVLQELIRASPDSTPDSNYIYFKHKNRLYTEAIKVIRVIKGAWRPGAEYTEQEAIDSFVRPSVLVIDEIGMQYGSPTEAQLLTEIINDRYNQKKPTILCGNVTIKEISEVIGDRIIDRFRDNGKVLVFDWDSYRGKT